LVQLERERHLVSPLTTKIGPACIFNFSAAPLRAQARSSHGRNRASARSTRLGRARNDGRASSMPMGAPARAVALPPM
jgi:hypothetical protein